MLSLSLTRKSAHLARIASENDEIIHHITVIVESVGPSVGSGSLPLLFPIFLSLLPSFSFNP